MPLKGLFRGGDESGSESGSSHSGGARRDSLFGGTTPRRESAFGKVARALLPNPSRRDRADRPFFNPEEHISQKREWSRRYTQQEAVHDGAADRRQDRLFEHFAVVGLPPTMNIREVAADLKTLQRLSRAAGAGGSVAAAAGGLEVMADTPKEERQRQYGLKGPAHRAEVLYSFPAEHGMPDDLAQSLAAFCFPHGVRPELLERTPSMSALNEIIYSQPYQTHDDHSFVFLMKVTDPSSVAPRTLYGVCCYVRELVHRPPSMAREGFPGCNAPLSRYLVVAPRCYCLLTHHPFFALHFRVLQTILGLERLDRMTSFASELAVLAQEGNPSAGSSSRLASSSGAASTASLPSVTQQRHAAAPAAREGAAAAAAGLHGAAAPGLPAAAAADAAPRDDASEGSSRRWTEGSGPEEQQGQQGQANGVLAALQQLSLAEHQGPPRRAQVSPHCAEPPPAAAQERHASPLAAGLAGADTSAAVTPTDQLVPAAAPGPTPFFTPAGPSSAIGTPAARAQQWVQQQQQQQAGDSTLQAPAPALAGASPQDGSAGIRRALDGDLAEVGSSSSSPPAPAGAGPDAVADAEATVAAAGSRQLQPASRAASPAPGSATAQAAPARPSSRRSSRPSSRQGQKQQQDEDGGSDSDAESYLTASSSTALLGLQQSPAEASSLPVADGAGPHTEAAHGRSLSALSAGSTSAAAAADGFGRSAAVPAAATSQQDELVAMVPPDAPSAGQRDAQQAPADGLPPLLELEDPAEALQQGAAAATPTEAAMPPALAGPAAAAAELPPLLQLDDDAGTQHGQREQQQQPRPPQQQQQIIADLAALVQVDDALAQRQTNGQVTAADGIGVHIAMHSVSSAPMAASASTPPRADLLTGAAQSRSARLQPLAAAAAAPDAAGSGQRTQDEQQQQGQQGGAMPPPPPRLPSGRQQQQHGGHDVHEVVRVTATNLDMSRPLQSTDLLSVYHASVVPQPGQVFEFQPDPGLQTICFERPDVVEAVRELGLRPTASSLPDIDAAQNLGGWAVAALCRSLSLENVVTFLTAVLLERQIVVFCPNAGVLSGIVLSLVPLLLPFHWQCLLLPVLPAGEGRLELMEAPVPFVLGVLYKTPEVRSKSGSLVRVNVYKDKVKNVGNLPQLPQQAALLDALAGSYSELRKIGLTRTATTRPVHMISDAQQVLAECFLSTLQKYLRGLMADLRGYCITDVSPSLERTSVLLKDSFVESFPPRDRPFMRQFAETQMFSCYCDAVI